MSEQELRKIRFQIILSMLNVDPKLQEQLEVYLK